MAYEYQLPKGMKNIIFRINGIVYGAVSDIPSKGDKVFDMKDGTHGILEGFFNGKATVRDGFVVEGLVNMDRLVKLIPLYEEITPETSLN